MDSKNGTPEEKGNASPPPRRGQIKAKIGEELRTFVTRGVGRKSEKDAWWQKLDILASKRLLLRVDKAMLFRV
jgi:hypothetical protein